MGAIAAIVTLRISFVVELFKNVPIISRLKIMLDSNFDSEIIAVTINK